MSEQQRTLEIFSTGSILATSQIQAVNLDTYDCQAHCDAVALWRRGATSPQYFAHGSIDADAIIAWANSQRGGEQFLCLPTMLFASDRVALTTINDKEAHVQLAGDPLPFVVPGAVAYHALLLWAGEATLPRKAVQV